jgi:N6-L-threonylcarbamoyladenine synthase
MRGLPPFGRGDMSAVGCPRLLFLTELMTRARRPRSTHANRTINAVSDTYILGIESSCDETAAAVVRSGEEVVSSVVYSQIATHQVYGGVVPELASREHLRAIVPVVHKALDDAGRSYDTIDAIAVTQGPGLAGSLLVGLSFAKALAFAAAKPLIAVNHLEGHIHAVLLEERQRGNHDLEFPVLALVVSGGHTHLYLAESHNDGWLYHNVGQTRDDAAGEAFDKVAKLLELGYPGGPVIDFLAPHGDASAVKFPFAQIKHRDRNPENRHAPEVQRVDFSYSGIKTAVLRYVEVHGMRETIAKRRAALSQIASPKPEDYLTLCDRQTLDLVASFQRAVVNDLVSKTLYAAREFNASTLLVTGGVAANSMLRTRFEQQAGQEGVQVYFPSRKLSTDNAAMIAAAAYPRYLAGEFADAELSAEAALRLR